MQHGKHLVEACRWVELQSNIFQTRSRTGIRRGARAKPGKGNTIYPYPRRDLSIERANQVWAFLTAMGRRSLRSGTSRRALTILPAFHLNQRSQRPDSWKRPGYGRTKPTRRISTARPVNVSATPREGTARWSAGRGAISCESGCAGTPRNVMRLRTPLLRLSSTFRGQYVKDSIGLLWGVQRADSGRQESSCKHALRGPGLSILGTANTDARQRIGR